MAERLSEPIKICPICFSYILDSTKKIGYRCCPNCGFAYKIGEEKEARVKAALIRKKLEKN